MKMLETVVVDAETLVEARWNAVLRAADAEKFLVEVLLHAALRAQEECQFAVRQAVGVVVPPGSTV